MKTYKGIPIYKAVVEDDEQMMYCISLVDDPATKSEWLAFKNEELLKFSVENEDKRIVRGLVMAANLPIIRRAQDGSFFYIMFDAETIRNMAQKYFKMGFQNNVDTMHNFKLESGVELVQMFIKDKANGVDPKGFEGYDDGSLFAEFKVENDEIWKAIKDGTYKGFSLAGDFGITENFSTVEDDEKECLELMNKIINRISK